MISAASLSVLSQLKDNCEISVLYIKPDLDGLNEKEKMQERLTFNVFQEYARSGLLKQVYLVDNDMMEDIIGEVPITEYYNRINDLIVSTIHMINIFNHSAPVVSTVSKPSDISRICTFGIAALDKKEEKLFFPLDEMREKQYYYAIPEKKIKTDGTLMKKIKEATRGEKTAYGVYSTSYEHEYIYCLLRSSAVQERIASNE